MDLALFGRYFLDLDVYKRQQPDGVRLLPCLTGVQQRRAVGHLDDIRGVAGCGHIQNGKAGIPVAQGVQPVSYTHLY